MIEARPLRGQIQYDVREIYDETTGVLRIRQVRLNGKLHSPPSGDPSHAAYDEHGRPLMFIWHEADVNHRTDGPATIHFETSEDRDIRREVYSVRGQRRPATLGPWRILRDNRTGEILSQDITTGLDPAVRAPGISLDP